MAKKSTEKNERLGSNQMIGMSPKGDFYPVEEADSTEEERGPEGKKKNPPLLKTTGPNLVIKLP